MDRIAIIQDFKTIILANGTFPEHEIPLSFLQHAERIICCDGGTENLLKSGLEPSFIVGDLDSLSENIKTHYSPILNHDPDQETNDLTKAVHFCVKNGWKEITILGATGKREDHSLGNISLLADYTMKARVQMLTDYGVFTSMNSSATFESFRGQQISIFSLTPPTLFTTSNLQYPLDKKELTSWWQGTLNEATEDHFNIEINQGKVLIFREYPHIQKK
ncbi:thiamine pyrophosphokinase [Bacteroidia bacterium]|nr:thiamine pyrophosphokinase [Bacteroidia bacterium]